MKRSSVCLLAFFLTGCTFSTSLTPSSVSSSSITDSLTSTTTFNSESASSSLSSLISSTSQTVSSTSNSSSSSTNFTSSSTSINESNGEFSLTCDKNYDGINPTIIKISGSSINVTNNNNVTLNGNKLIISNEGYYELGGSTTNLQIVINANEESKVNLSLDNFSIKNNLLAPFAFLSASKVNFSSKKDTTNYIEDNRDVNEVYDENAAVYAKCDLDVQGNGTLKVVANYHNGIDTSDDLYIKNLNLTVEAQNDGLKGNDSITVESGKLKIISKTNDTLKTSNSGISSKGNQKGYINLLGGSLSLYAATDCLDAAYDIMINEGVTLDCYSGKHSSYSEDVTYESTSTLYLKTSNQQIYNNDVALNFLMSDGSYKWSSASYIGKGAGGRGNSYYFEIKLPTNAEELTIYSFTKGSQGSSSNYNYKSEEMLINDSFNCLSLTLQGNNITTNWTNYNPNGGGGGGFNDANNERSPYSAKGLKANNQIEINGGIINIKANDDGIHSNNTTLLDNGNYGLGNVYVRGGEITIYSDDDAIHADNNLVIEDGNINITNSYEGLEANVIEINGGITMLKSRDDGVNASGSNPYLYIRGGILYLDSNGDGLDSNGYIQMSGGYAVCLGPTNGGNGVLDFDRQFTFTGGYLLAIGASGMNQKPTASGSNVYASSKSISTQINSYVALKVDNNYKIILKVTKSNQNYVAYAYEGSNGQVETLSSISQTLVNDLYYVG